ncbi:MAG: TIGR03809 family protein [Bradyrhizobium sp.]
MTQLADVACGRELAARWCNLAEKRVEYLTDLFETGRWRRFYSERAFLENVGEAKAAVETWRALTMGVASPAKSTTGLTGLHNTPSPRPRHDEIPVQQVQAEPEPFSFEPVSFEPLREIPEDVLIALENQLFASDEAPSVTDAPDLDDMTMQPLDLDLMQRRYPLLRNAL